MDGKATKTNTYKKPDRGKRRWTNEVKPKANVKNGQGKKKRDYGLNQRIHKDMLTKLVTAISLPDASSFQSKVATLRAELLEYMDRPLMPPEQAYFMIHLMGRVSQVSTNPTVFSLLSNFCRSMLLQEQLCVHFLTWRREKSSKELKEIAESCLMIFERTLRTFPTSLQEVQFVDLRKLVRYLKSKELSQRLNIIEDVRYEYGKKISAHYAPPTYSSSNDVVTGEMKNFDFRQLSTIPLEKDIVLPAPIETLNPVIKYGPYPSGEDYLDTTFRLLREDLISPLRSLVKDYQTPSKRHTVTSFEHVRVLYPICTFRGITYRVSFDVAKYRGFPWESSKKLIFGSLLCFSTDDFRTMLFGTVSNREAFLLRKGELDVRFDSNTDLHDYVRGGAELTMLECPSFFEAYRHAMDCFKDLNPYAIPMQKYIIDCNTELQPPKYLREQPFALYDLTECFGVTKGQDPRLYSICKSILMNTTKEWDFETLLNKSQMDAVRHALTTEFSLIQGPPGTGKTFCGLRIAHALLVNNKFWNRDGETPMIIVAYTNHALDQFLTGLAEYGHKNILRVGSRYAENLEEFSMEVAKEKFRTKMNRNNCHKDLRYMKSTLFESRDQFAGDLGPYMMSVKSTQEALKRGKLVTFNQIRTCIEKRHSAFFLEHDQHCIKLKISIFDIFLQLCKIPTSILNNVSRKLKNENNNEGTSLNHSQTKSSPYTNESYLYHRRFAGKEHDGDTINIVGEGNALTERWVIDENEYRPAYNNNEDVANQKQAVDEDDIIDDGCFMDENGFQLVTLSKWDKQRKVRSELMKVDPMSAADVRTIHNPWDLPISERWRLYKYWLGLYMRSYDEKIERLMQQYEDTCAQATQIREKEQELILKSKDVVAMTTSCASRYRNILERIKPKVIIIEEAAEVMEAHVISSLLTSTEHCILIGDHKQLRPNPSVYELATKYGLELSLFERMVENLVKCVSLSVQHRMRPEISFQLRHIYPGLQNHVSVTGYPDIKGVSKNLFFINHAEQESCDYRFNSSKSNSHEARFMQALCYYFLQQGYQPSQITVLTGYSGQLQKLKSVMPKDLFEGVKVTSVDNFQGEENDIILLSLVRSNQRNSIGFLKTENRICVALSRAKHGLYVIGNFDLLGKESDIWRNIIDDVKSQSCYGESLTLTCQNHSNASAEVATADDFEQFVPEGGCMLLCEFILPCTHLCKSHCHPHDREHQYYECEEICTEKVCRNPDHSCGRQCHYGEECGPCKVQIEATFPCGHKQLLSCSLDATEAICLEPCSNRLSCGHTCSNGCGQSCVEEKDCEEKVAKYLPCGHTLEVACSTQPNDACCDADCTTVLHCGHSCSGDCTKCMRGRSHAPCTQPCDKVFVCGHICADLCGHTCFGCKEECYMECEHMECDQSCNKNCKPCEETCNRSCPHQKCNNNCGQPCDVEPCNKPCELLLNCEHGCLGMCGEECPPVCRICNRDSKLFHGLPREARFITLQDCDHVFEVNMIDEMFEKTPNEVSVKCCPSCQTPILNTPRYKNDVFQTKTHLRQIEDFYRKHDGELTDILKHEVYATCHDTTSNLICKKKKDCLKNYQTIVQCVSLKEFEKNLDLKYLARQQSSNAPKPDVLLIAERLSQCRSSTDAIRLHNQMGILKYTYDIGNIKDDIGTLDGQLIHILTKLGKYQTTAMNPNLSIQQAKDLLGQIDGMVLEIKCMFFRSKVRKRTRNGNYRSSSDLEQLNNADAILTDFLKVFRGQNTVFGDQNVDKLFDILDKARKDLSIRPVNIGRCKLYTETPLSYQHSWFRCKQNHIYVCVTDNNGPVQCPKCEQEIEGVTEILHDLSLAASNNDYDTSEDGESDSQGGESLSLGGELHSPAEESRTPEGDSGYVSSVNKKERSGKKRTRSSGRSARKRKRALQKKEIENA